MQQDILYRAAKEYNKLHNVVYDIKLGRKGKAYNLMLHFPSESFFHLTGMQHLDDLKFPSSNKERIFKEILKGRLTIEYLKKSIHYKEWNIEERIRNLYLIEKILEDNKVIYKINPREYRNYSTIIADYLLEYQDIDIYYLFVIKERMTPKFDNEHKGCSFLKKDKADYTRGTAKTTLLLLNKILNYGKDKQEEIQIYINPSYKI